MESVGSLIELSVESVRVNLATQRRVVILKERNQERERHLFLWIAHAEAYAIAVHLQGTHSPRPLTHDLIKNLLEKIGTRVVRVVITDLVEEIFYASIVLDVAGQEMEVDARPSDAIALAVRTQTPIFITEPVFERCGVRIEPEDDASTPQPDQKTTPLEQKNSSSEQEMTPVKLEQAEGGINSEIERSTVRALTTRLTQVEEELRRAQARIAELEGK